MKKPAFTRLLARLELSPRRWLVTGAAGFIGSHLVETLLRHGQRVVGLDNFSTGHRENLARVRAALPQRAWRGFRLIEGDIRDLGTCRRACRGADHVLHQAALGSVPRSIARPLDTHASNVDGFLNMLVAARDSGIPRLVFASSSSVYGDHAALPKREARIGDCLSPYALTKRINELYAAVFARCYPVEYIGLRYFNVFGPRQDPNGAYAAVIPRWIAAMIDGKPIEIFGDGRTSRDFCYVANVVQANLLAATTGNPHAVNQTFNVAVQATTHLNRLFEVLRRTLLPHCPHLRGCRPDYRDFRAGDVRHSKADIGQARRLLGYEPTHRFEQGIVETARWFYDNHRSSPSAPQTSR